MKVSEKYVEYGTGQLRIVEAVYVDSFKLILSFSNGEQKEVDFKRFIQSSTHPDVKKYQDLSHFKAFNLSDGNLVWGDYEMLFPIADLYYGSID